MSMEGAATLLAFRDDDVTPRGLEQFDRVRVRLVKHRVHQTSAEESDASRRRPGRSDPVRSPHPFRSRGNGRQDCLHLLQLVREPVEDTELAGERLGPGLLVKTEKTRRRLHLRLVQEQSVEDDFSDDTLAHVGRQKPHRMQPSISS